MKFLVGSQKEEGEKGPDKIFEEIIVKTKQNKTKNFPNMEKKQSYKFRK